MDYQLFIETIRQFNGYNAVPVWIADNKRILFSTVDDASLSDEALSVLREFPVDKIRAHAFNELEYFISMPCPYFDKAVLVLGNYCLHPINAGYKGSLVTANFIKHERLREYILTTPPTNKNELLRYANLLARLTENQTLESLSCDTAHSLKRQLDRDLTEFIFTNAENEIFPYSPESERRILDMIRAGDVEGVRRINTSFFSDKADYEVKYLFKIVALITLATRAAIEGGAETIDAYGLSDLYLAQLAPTKTDNQISHIAKDVLPHFAELVNKRRETVEKTFSPHLAKAEKYIKTHLHYPLSLQKVASAIGINDKYLSRLFVKCKGEKFSHFVNRMRVYEAKELLVNTDLKLADITYSLAFVSESYFIKIFDQICGTTPQKFRNEYKQQH